MPRYGVHSPRFFALLSRVREAAPPEEWYREAVEEVRETEMSFAERIKMRLNGYIYIGQRWNPGHRGPLPYYRFRCPVHGLVESYPHGYEKILRCPFCQASTQEATKRTNEK